MSRDFLKLIAVAMVIAAPLAWYLMRQWLQQFPYRTGIDWWIFPGAGAAAVLVALVAVGFQHFKAALANPVESLRSE